MLEGLAVLGMTSVSILVLMIAVPIVVKIRSRISNPPPSVQQSIEKTSAELDKVNKYIDSL